MRADSKLLEEKCIYPYIYIYLSISIYTYPQLWPEIPDLWGCAQSCELSVPAEPQLTARGLRSGVGFAVSLLAQDSS